MTRPTITPARIAELKAEIEHRRSIACESIGPLALDEVEALLDAARVPHRCEHGKFCPHYEATA